MKTRGLICVSVAGKNTAETIAAVLPVADQADVVEIRLDHLKDPSITACMAAISRPLLFTNRPVWEGGNFTGSEEERIESLCSAARLGAAYVDIELATTPRLRRHLMAQAMETDTRVIVSSHDFSGTPALSSLQATLTAMKASGAAVGKVVTTANAPAEVVRLLSLLGEANDMDFPLIALAMGEHGRISRFASLYLGGYMTYAAIDDVQATAPGQLSVARLHTLISCFASAHDH